MLKHRFSFGWLAGLLLLHSTASAGDLVEAQKLPEQRPTLALQFGHIDAVTSVAFSPDGKQVLTGSFDTTVRMWDSASGREIRAFRLFDHVSSVAFSPDGKCVLAGGVAVVESRGGTVRLWDAASGQEIWAFKHPRGVTSVAFSPNGKQVLTGSQDKAARLWDAASGREIRTFRGHERDISCVAFSPDGKQVLTGSYDETVRLWDAQSGKELRTFPMRADSKDSFWVGSVAFSRDGKQVLTGILRGEDTPAKARLWDVASGKEIQTFWERVADVSTVAFSPDGKRVLTGTQLWDAASGKLIRAFPGSGKSAALSPDGKQVLTTDRLVARLWAVESRTIRTTFDGHAAMVTCVAFSPDGTRVLTGSRDKTARLWDAASRKEIRAFPHTGFVGSVAFSRDGKQVLTGSGRTGAHRSHQEESRDPENAAWLWDAASGKLINTFKTQGAVDFVAFSPDGRHVLTKDDRGQALLRDTASGRVILSFHPKEAVAFSPDGTRVLTGSLGSTAQLWDAASGKEIGGFTHKDSGTSFWGTLAIRSVAFSPDGRQVLTGGSDRTAHLWDVANGKEIRTLQGHTGGLSFVAFSPDGKQVLTGSEDKTARLWDAQTGKQLRAFPGHPNAFSADGKQVLMASDDQTARWWDAASGKVIRTFGHLRGVAVAFSPDGKQAIAATGEQVRLWEAGADENDRDFELRTFAGLARSVTAVAFSPDAKRVVTVSASRPGSPLQRVRVWDLPSVKVISSFSIRQVESVAFSPNGKYLVTVSPPPPPPPVGRRFVLQSLGQPVKTVRLWDPASGKEITALLSAKPIHCVAFSPDGKLMVTVTNVVEENPVVDYGRSVVWRRRVDTARLCNASTGEEIRTFDLARKDDAPGTKMLVHSAVFSGDGTRVIMVGVGAPDSPHADPDQNSSSNGPLGVWNVARGEKIEYDYRNSIPFDGAKIDTPRRNLPPLAVSPDGRQLLGDRHAGTASLWDVATGKELQEFVAEHSRLIQSVGFSSDGKQVLTRDGDRARLWDVASGRKIHEFPASIATLSPDGKQLLTTESNDQAYQSGKLDAARLWDTATGQEIHALQGHTDQVACVAFSPDGRLVLTGSVDGTARIWRTASGREVGRLLAFADGTWAAATPDNYYTASKGALKGVAFRVGKQVFPFDQFDLKFNRPDKVLESLGLASEEVIAAYRHAYQKRLKRVNFTEQMLGDDFHLPTVAFLTQLPLATRQKSITLKLKARDAKYLLDRLNVSVNGVPLGGAAGIAVQDQKTSSWEQTVDIELSRGPNRIELSAINEKGAESLRESFEIDCDAPPGKPDLYVVVVGVSAYQDARYRLTYADKDANDLADYLETRKENFNQVQLVRLVNQDATRDKILESKRRLRQSKVDDQVIVFFAGHGLLDDRLDYYFATVDVDFSKPSAKGLSYEAIEDLLDGIPARKKLLLMDTCHSGEVDKEEMAAQVAQHIPEGEVKRRGFRGLDVDQPFGLQNSLRVQQELFADLRRGSGAVMISAAGGMEFALESPHWKNGVFTYALLRGLKDKQADRNKDNQIQVSELRDYITDEVRRLTGDRQSPTIRMENLEFDYTLD